MTNKNNENNQFPIIKLYIFIHMIKFEINSNYTDKSCMKISQELFKNAVPNFLWTVYRALNHRTEHGKNRYQPVSRLNRLRDLFKLELGYRKLAMPIRLGPLQLSTNVPSSHFHEGGWRWNGSIGRLTVPRVHAANRSSLLSSLIVRASEPGQLILPARFR